MTKGNTLFGKNQRAASEKNNSENEPHARHFFNAEPSSQTEKACSTSPHHFGVCADTDLPWLKTLWQFGRQRAFARGSTRRKDDDEKKLIAHAEAMAEAHTPLPWDPVNNPHDAHIIKHREQLETELDLFKGKLAEQITDLEEVEREYANLRKCPDKPVIPLFKAVFCIIAFGLSVTPALYDGLFNRLDDELSGYLFSVLTGLALAIAIVWSIISSFKNTSVSRKRSYSFWGGLSACVALAALRFWAAGDSAWAILLAIALFLLELAIVLFCEDTASGLRVSYLNYTEIRGNSDRQAALVEAARRCVERTEKTIAEIRQRINAYNDHIKERISRRGQIEHLKKLAVSVVLDGYQAGLAEIEGRFRVPWKIDDEIIGGGK